jgi:hypothetical protein
MPLPDDADYAEIRDDVNEEASKHGQVMSVEIPRPNTGTNESAVGKVSEAMVE